MVYDRDLRGVNLAIWILLVGNLCGGIDSVFRFPHQWPIAAGYFVWSVNALMLRKMNRNFQRQRDRNREVEAAILKVLAGDRY